MTFASADFMSKPPRPTVIPERFIQARERSGLSQAALAERVGMQQSSIGSIEIGRSARPGKLRELARAMMVSEDWLLGESDQALPEAVEGESAPPNRPAPNASFPPTYQPFPEKSVPLLGQTAAGPNSRFILNGQRVRDVFCPPELAGVEGAYAVQVFGYSMEPKFEPGEVVWINPHAPVRKNDYVVVQVADDDEAQELSSYIKQFVSRSGGILRLRQFNPDEGETEIIEFPTELVMSVHKIVFTALV